MKKNVVIAGSSRGIGLELVKQFAEEAHQVVALSRNIDSLKELDSPQVRAISCDIADEKSVKEVVKHIKFNWDGIDILINNAGRFLKQDFSNTKLKDVKSIYDTNVFGVFNLTHQLMPFMMENGHVVTVSSMGGVQGSVKFPGLAAYSSSKAAVITLTELLAEEYKENGPSFNVIALGAVQTEMLEEAFPGVQAPNSAEEMAEYIKDFAENGNRFYNGKLLQASSSTP